MRVIYNSTEEPKQTSSLVGLFFYTGTEYGKVLAELGGGYYLNELFDPIDGQSKREYVISHVQQMHAGGWRFYLGLLDAVRAT